jgi:predicted lipid-binding transport protein (Tim44 family)
VFDYPEGATLVSEQGESLTACPRCGEPSDGSSWCQRCGLNLRPGRRPVSTKEPGRIPVPVQSSPPSTPQPRRPWLAVVAAAGLLILGVLVAAIVGLLVMRGDDTQVLTVAQTIVETTPAATPDVTSKAASTSASPARDPVLPVADIESLLIDYQSAYSNENLAALRSLFTADLVRDPGSGPPQELSDALATYRKQFSDLDEPVYQLSDVTVTTTPDEAEAVGKYVITEGGRRAGSGSIAFHIVRLDDRLYIDRVGITPSS